MGVSLNGGTPKTPPKWSFLVGKPMVVGYHQVRKPPYGFPPKGVPQNDQPKSPRMQAMIIFYQGLGQKIVLGEFLYQYCQAKRHYGFLRLQKVLPETKRNEPKIVCLGTTFVPFLFGMGHRLKLAILGSFSEGIFESFCYHREAKNI